MKYNSINYIDFSSKRKFGIELEMGHTIPKLKVANIIKTFSKKKVVCTGYKLSSNNDYWHVKDDSTCGLFGKNGPKGVEVASYVAQGIEDVDHLSFVGRMLAFSGCKTNFNCGYHIHTEAIDLDVNCVGILIANWLKIEPWIENMLPSYRRENKYCKKLSTLKVFSKESYWNPQDLFVFFAPKNLNTFENEERRTFLNLVNYVKYVLFPTSDNTRATIELRCPEGTLDYFEIKFWLQFFLNFIDSSKKSSMPLNLCPCSNIDEFLTLIGLNHQNNNFFIFGRNLFETRNWVLKRLISNGSFFYKNNAKKKLSFLNDNTLNIK